MASGLLAGLLLALAFLLASFPARNGDLWRHLASGRDLARASAGPGVEVTGLRPFATWGADLLLYLGHQALGGAGLVVAKALLTAGLALLLFRLASVEAGPGLAALCVSLALLAVGTRLLLQPAILSYLMLALALIALSRRGPAPGQAPAFPWPMLVLFVVWVNLDPWFLLGLAVVAATWCGEALDDVDGTGRWAAGQRRLLWIVLVVAACLLNPAGPWAFAPGEGWRLPWLAGTPGSLLAASPIASPFEPAYYTTLGRLPAGLAYFVLLGLSALSFALNLPRWRWRRLLPWLVVVGVSATQARAIPFFAIVAGPVLAWNLGEALARRAGLLRRGLLEGLAGLLTLTLAVCAWPGWLQSPPFGRRQWELVPPAALEETARELKRWYEDGSLRPESCGLHLSAESAFAFAWLCPEARGLYDAKFTAALLEGQALEPDDRQRLRAAGVDHVIVYHPDRLRLFRAVGQLVAAGQPLLFVRGDLAIFGWGLAGASPSPRLRREMDVERLAFQPPREARAPEAPPEPAPSDWPRLQAFWQPPPPRPVDRDEATLYLAIADAHRSRAPLRHLIAWQAGQIAGLVGGLPGTTGPAALLDGAVRLTLFHPPLPETGPPPPVSRAIRSLQQAFTRWRDDVPPGLLYLALRAARRATAANPADARAWLVMGEAYLRLLHQTRERGWSERFAELGQLRRAQASAALVHALEAQPDLPQAHLNLGALFSESGHLDLALKHRRDYLRVLRQAGPPPALSAREFREQLAAAEEALGPLQRAVEQQTKRYEAEGLPLRVLDRAAHAAQLGLSGKALEVLLGSDLSAFGSRGMALELDLLLSTGRAREVRDWTSPEMRAALGEEYHWVRARAFAAEGDYGSARGECALLALGQRAPDAPAPAQMMAPALGQAILEANPYPPQLATLQTVAMRQVLVRRQVSGLARGVRREADAHVLRGLLALEQGAMFEATAAFELALRSFSSEQAVAEGSGIDFSARPIAQQALEWLQ